jgi:hypothetical protein
MSMIGRSRGTHHFLQGPQAAGQCHADKKKRRFIGARQVPGNGQGHDNHWNDDYRGLAQSFSHRHRLSPRELLRPMNYLSDTHRNRWRKDHGKMLETEERAAFVDLKRL